MFDNLFGSKFAIVGGGKFCRLLLKFFFENPDNVFKPEIFGVADVDEQAPGLVYAAEKGVFTTDDYTKFFQYSGLEVILELTHDPALTETIRRNKPSSIRLIDHFEARSIWDTFQVRTLKRQVMTELEMNLQNPHVIIDLFHRMTDRFSQIFRERNDRSREIERELMDNELTQSQIIQGSTIPTFVINKDHVITHWNKAMERLSGIPSESVVGTKKHWMPFYEKKRLTMADVILDQIEAEEIRKLYGTKWRKSALIEGAYEAEGFFPRLGENGRWCWFTAAPIKSQDGMIIGAIETLWDKTEDKKAEEEKERHTRELAALCSIYTALSAPVNLDDRITETLKEIRSFFSADSICVFMLGKDELFHLTYTMGTSESLCKKNRLAGENSVIYRVAGTDDLTIFEDLSGDTNEEIGMLEQEGLKSLAYIPISAKEKKAFGVIRIGSKISYHFSPEERHVLELIGNRIGVAIENAMLQKQYIGSEEKYRSLFNNDPNPIFIINSKSFKIWDINQRAQDCYEYERDELVGMSFLRLGDENDVEVANGLKSLVPKRSVLFSKKRHYRKGGRPFYVNINVSHATYQERAVFIATTTDITESIEKETQLIQAGKMTTLGVMAAGMAHEINQPLNVIQICADFFLKMLKKGQRIKDEDLKSMANDIIANVDRATGVIKHVRDFARQSEVVRSRVNINDPIQDVFKVMGNQLKVHQIELVLNLQPDLPHIMAEHNRLEQVFINLVTNAIDAMDEKAGSTDGKAVEKRLTIESYYQNHRVVVTVSDTGTGMSNEVQSKIFEPFFTTKKTGKGTGLGISISYGIIKDYDGTIELESKVGEGTTFKFSFPVFDEKA